MSSILMLIGQFTISSGSSLSHYHSKPFLNFLKSEIIGSTLIVVDNQVVSNADHAMQLILNAGQQMEIVLGSVNELGCQKFYHLEFGRNGDGKFGLEFSPENPPKYCGSATGNNMDVNLIQMVNSHIDC